MADAFTITEVTFRPVSDTRSEGKLKGYASVVINGVFAVHEIRLIEGRHGLFVSMPDKKETDWCRECGTKNHLMAKFCNGCGRELPPDRDVCRACRGRCRTEVLINDAYFPEDCRECAGKGRVRTYRDIAHPRTQSAREAIQAAVLRAYRGHVAQERGLVVASGVVAS